MTDSQTPQQSLETLALLGKLPASLRPDQVMRLWHPWVEAKASIRGRALYQAANNTLKGAIESGELRSRKDRDTTRPSQGSAVRVNTFLWSDYPDDIDDLWRRTASKVETVKGATWIEAGDFLEWTTNLPAALWPPASTCMLWSWLGVEPFLANTSASPDLLPSKKRIPAKAHLGEVDKKIAEGCGVNEALRLVAAEKGIAFSALKKARSEASGGRRQSTQSKAKARPRLQLVKSGEK